MLKLLIGCRLESIKLSKMSWTLEFEGAGAAPAHFVLSSSANVKFKARDASDEPSYSAIRQLLEDDVIEARHDETDRIVTLRFSEGVELQFSNQYYEGGDNSAIVTNLADNSWELFN